MSKHMGQRASGRAMLSAAGQVAVMSGLAAHFKQSSPPMPPSLSRRRAGANQGLGYQTSLELARRGATLYMVRACACMEGSWWLQQGDGLQLADACHLQARLGMPRGGVPSGSPTLPRC